MTADLTPLEAALDDWPTDWPSRLVYADLLEDAGRASEAAYQRWAAANLVAPHNSYLEWVWVESVAFPYDPAVLARVVCAWLRPTVATEYRQCAYHTRAEAEADLRRVAGEVGYGTVGELVRLWRDGGRLTPPRSGTASCR